MISCSIDLCNRCQNDCVFCIAQKYLDGSVLDYGVYLRLLEDLERMRVKSIVFSGGGEPLLYPHFQQAVIDASSLGFRLGLFTNGIILDDFLGIASKFTFIKVSLDAGSVESYKRIKGTNSYDRVIRNIDKIKDLTYTTIGWVLLKENCSEIFNAERVLDGVGSINIKRDVRVVKRRPTSDSCRSSRDLGIVASNGKVYYCTMKKWDDRYLLGDLAVDRMPIIWERRRQITVDCYDCRFGGIKHDGFV